ncbi:MAG TPA: HEAT repeat domain-containing protein [Vicinamibacterales bacterium]|nr:HEAT repeat domain-containing protein [Vicinamibacterales bacterium]
MSKSTDTLITDLSSDRDTTREAAIARLAVIGARAVDRLIDVAASGSPVARTAALQALERIGDRRALPAALRLVGDADQNIALAAIGVARGFVKGKHGVDAVDRLTAVAVDRSKSTAVRAAAVDALKQLPVSTIDPLLAQLADDPAVTFAEPAAMQATLMASAKAPLPTLLAFVEEIRQREQTAAKDERAEWLAARGAAHALLAKRGSTIALYDLRETFETAKAPLLPDYVTALTKIGDASCLEAIAVAFSKAKDVVWKKTLADAFRSIAKRERITRRHAVVKKLEKKLAVEMKQIWGG